MQIHLFGSIDVDLGQSRLDARSFGGRKPKQLLEMLLLRRGRPLPTEELAWLLWGDAAPAAYPATVQHYASVLRRRLPAGPVRGSLLTCTRSGYVLDQTRFQLDLDQFDAAVEAAEHAPVGLRRPLLDRALDLVRGDVLADEPDAPWAVDERVRYRRSHVRLLLQASAAALGAAEPRRARELARAAVAHEPYAEPAACLLIAAHYATGDGAAALSAFDSCRRGLAEELGVDPMPQTVDMQRAVLRHAPVAELVGHALRVAHAQAPAGERLRVSA